MGTDSSTAVLAMTSWSEGAMQVQPLCLVAVVIALVSSIGFVGCGATSGRRGGAATAELEEHLEEGRSLMRQGQRVEAIAAFEDATYADPESAEAHYLLARARLELGRTYQALDALRVADRLRPDHSRQRILLGQIHLRSNRLEEAERVLERAVETWPDEPRAHLALGRLRLQQGRLEEAEVSLTRTVRLAPRAPGAQELRGRVLLRLGRSDQSIASFESAIEQHDDDDLAHGGLAAALVVSLQPARAQAEFQRAAECAGEEHAGPWRAGIAVAYAAEGRFDDALSGFGEVPSTLLQPRVAAALRARLQFLRLGWEASGCTAHETICAQADQRFWSGVLLLFVLGAADAAEREILSAIDLYDGDAMTHWILAESLAELDRHEEALLELERATAWNPAEEVTNAMEGLRQELGGSQ